MDSEPYFACIPQENQHMLKWKLDKGNGGVEIHLGEIAGVMTEWEGDVATSLGLNPVDVANIKDQYRDKLSLKTRAVLQRWKEKYGFKATYGALIKSFLKAKKPEYAEAVCKVLGGTPGRVPARNPHAGQGPSDLNLPTQSTSRDPVQSIVTSKSAKDRLEMLLDDCDAEECDREILKKNCIKTFKVFQTLCEQDLEELNLSLGVKRYLKCQLLQTRLKKMPHKRVDTDSEPNKETLSTVNETQKQDESNETNDKPPLGTAGIGQSEREPESEDQLHSPELDGWFGNRQSSSSHKPYPRKMNPDHTMPHTPVLKINGEETKITETGQVQPPGHPDTTYKMKHTPHGVALIISNKKFKTHSVRNGTEVDEDNLSETFRFLGYRVKIYRDCKKEKMEKLFDTIDQLVEDDDDSFVCCILSHGRDNIIYGSDSERVFLHSKENSLERKLVSKCKSLEGKPKMFFVSTCRGFNVQGDTRGTDGSEPPELDGDSPRGDMAFYYSTLPGESSTRYSHRGTVYIEKLCEVLCRSATSMTLSDMQKQVTKELDVQHPASEERFKQNIYFFNDIDLADHRASQ